MKLSKIPPAFCAALFALSVLFGPEAKADVLIQAKVLSSDDTSTTVQFTFTGDLPASLVTPPNLKSFLFVDMSTSTGLQNSLSTSGDYQSFNSNTAQTSAGATIGTVEIRNNESYYFNRLSFIFSQDFSAGVSLAANSVLEVAIPTSIPLVTSDFSNLKVYWGFPAFGTNNGRGTLTGIMNPVSENPTISIAHDTPGQPVITFTGVLESSPDLVTPFSAVTGAVSPYTVPASSASRFFFRASVTQ